MMNVVMYIIHACCYTVALPMGGPAVADILAAAVIGLLSCLKVKA